MMKKIILSLAILGLVSCSGDENVLIKGIKEDSSSINTFQIPDYERLVEIKFNSSGQPIIITSTKYGGRSYYIYLPYNDGTFRKQYKIIDNIK